jgi:hypothetical protein
VAREDDAPPLPLAARIDRLESLEAIRQLPQRYAQAVDSRNLDELVALFVEDVRVGPEATGRTALREWFADSLGRVGATVHLIGSHVIDLESEGCARGVVTCRDEVERGGEWAVGCLQYWDSYERRDGRWYFARRRFQRWYLVDALSRPGVGAGVGDDGLSTGQLPEAWPSWQQFWDERGRREP